MVTNGDDVPLINRDVLRAWRLWASGGCTYEEYVKAALAALEAEQDTEPE